MLYLSHHIRIFSCPLENLIREFNYSNCFVFPVDVKIEDVYTIEDETLDVEFEGPSVTTTKQKKTDILKLPDVWENWEEFNRLPWSEDESSIIQQKGSKRIEWINQPQFPKMNNRRLVLNKDSNECPICDEFFPIRLVGREITYNNYYFT